MTNLTTHKETITVLKPKSERFNDGNDNKTNRYPKLTIGYYILNLNNIQKNILTQRKNDNIIDNDFDQCSNNNNNNDNSNSNLNKDKTNKNKEINLNKNSKIDVTIDIFDSPSEINDVTNTCKGYHSMTKVELPNQQMTSVPNDVWKLNSKFNNTEDKRIKLLHSKLYLNIKCNNAINKYPIRLLDLSCNYLKQISSEIKNLNTLQILNLSNNQLTSLPNELAELHELEEIHLSYNLFQSFPKILFKLQNLKVLFIKCNYISLIDKELKHLNQLQVLDVSQNNLYSWPYPVTSSKTITELILDNNKMSIVPDQIHSMKHLKYLSLKCNHIRRLPKMHKLNSLELIDISNNSIQIFPDFYGSIHLREIHLDHNQIQKMDCNYLIGTTTVILTISCNKLNDITGNLSLIESIRFLDISNNELKSMPNDFYKIESIKKIKLNGNNFNDPNIIKNNELGINYLMEYLRKIDTDKLISIPDGPRYTYIDRYDENHLVKSNNDQRCLKLTMDSNGYLPNWMFRKAEYDEVIRLDMSMNKQRQMPSQLWKTSPFLEELYANNNFIVKIPVVIGHFIKLRILDLYSNNLINLPQELSFCAELYYLNISCNKFTELPSVIFNMKQLKVLLVSDNKIKEINMEMLKHLKKYDISKNCIQKFIFNSI